MSKAILVMDIPDSCSECPCCGDCVDICHAAIRVLKETDLENQKPDWCPLKEVPEKKSEFSAQNDYLLYSAKGWNACIDEILKEKDKS